MNYNELIEAEIKKQVEERTKDLEISYKNKFEVYKQNLLDNFVMPIYLRLRNVNIEIEKSKNEFDECAKTFFDKCEEFFDIKDEKSDRKEETEYIDKYFGKTTKELNIDKLNKTTKSESSSEKVENEKNDLADKIKETVKSKSDKEENAKKIEVKNAEKIVEETLDSMKDLLDMFGISKEDFKNAKVKILNNKDAFDEISKIYNSFGDLWNF